MKESKQIWIEAGYRAFALHGMAGIKVEPLARKAGISKSSFYHHFADTALFVDELLACHLRQSHLMAARERECETIDPDLIQVLCAHAQDLLFSRQLRVLRGKPHFEQVLAEADQVAGAAFIPVWVKDLNLRFSQRQLAGIFSLALENFYLQLTPERLTPEWLAAYFLQLKKTLQAMNMP